MYSGQEVHGELHSTDASSGAEIVLYRAGTKEVFTLGANHYLNIHSVEVISDVGGDCFVHVGTSAGSPAAGEYVTRGTFAANGGRAGELKPHFTGAKGSKPYLTAPAGAVDCILKATVRGS